MTNPPGVDAAPAQPITLYYRPGTCAIASYIALEEAGARYRAVDVSSQPERLLAINARGKVIGENGGIGTGNGNFGLNVSPSGTITLSNGENCPNKLHLPHLAQPRVGVPGPAANRAIQECVNRLGIREVLTYQPISRYWPFQWYETAIYVGLALVLAGFCVWWVRRRLS